MSLMEKIRAQGYLREAQADASLQNPEIGLQKKIIWDAAFRKALDAELDQIKTDDFEGIYSETERNQDERTGRGAVSCHAKDRNYHEMDTSIAQGIILEALMIEQIELNNWLGARVNTIATTGYDDVSNGIDLLAEIHEANHSTRYIGCAIDVTSARQRKTIMNKFTAIRTNLHEGRLGRLKYFQSSDGSIKGQRSMLPKVVLNLDQKSLLALAKLWVEGKQKSLAEHPIRDVFREQILVQLKAQADYVIALRDHGLLEEDKADKMITVLMNEHEAMQQTSPPAPITDSALAKQQTIFLNRCLRAFDPNTISVFGENHKLQTTPHPEKPQELTKK